MTKTSRDIGRVKNGGGEGHSPEIVEGVGTGDMEGEGEGGWEGAVELVEDL